MGTERRQQKNAETKNAILEAAVEIGLTEGFDELSIRKITDKLGYSVAIVYHYFKDKQEILDTIHNRTSMELMNFIRPHIKPEEGVVNNLQKIFRMMSEISYHNPDMFKLILLNKYTYSSEAIKPWIDITKQSIDYGISNGELREVNSEILSYMLLLDVVVTNQMIIQEKPNSKIEDIYQATLDIILNGIIKK